LGEQANAPDRAKFQTLPQVIAEMYAQLNSVMNTKAGAHKTLTGTYGVDSKTATPKRA